MTRKRLRMVLGTLLVLVLVCSAVTQEDAAGAEGAALYAANCAGCHQSSGEGLAGVFPPLAGHVATLYAAEGGRRYLADVLLFGLQGSITVDGVRYDGVMPGWFQLSDHDIAAVLNHIMTAWGDADELATFEPYQDEEIAAARRGALSPQLVLQRRPDLDDSSEDAKELPLATFTQAQVERARPIYERLCAECHGDSFTGGLIGGPPLTGPIFLQRWGGRSVATLYTYTKTQMPQGGPDSLPPQQYADLVALILSVNGHEAGEVELRGNEEVLEGVGIRSP